MDVDGPWNHECQVDRMNRSACRTGTQICISGAIYIYIYFNIYIYIKCFFIFLKCIYIYILCVYYIYI